MMPKIVIILATVAIHLPEIAFLEVNKQNNIADILENYPQN